MNTKNRNEARPGVAGGESEGRTLRDVAELIRAEIVEESERLDEPFEMVGASDLMSDVLAFMKPGSLLLTGLKNPQAVRTAEMADLIGIVFVRGRSPDPQTVELARTKGIPLLTTPLTMFEACGRLHVAGFKPCF